MANLTIKIPHNKTQEEAVECVKNLLSNAKANYKKEITDLNESWNGHEGIFSFKVRGYEISGTLIVGKMEVVLNGEIPWALTLFKGKIEKIILEQAQPCLR